MVTYNWIKTGSGKSLVLDDTKLSPELMLVMKQWYALYVLLCSYGKIYLILLEWITSRSCNKYISMFKKIYGMNGYVDAI